MRRILVPLDGTPMAESILPDANRLAGVGGRLILVRDVLLSYFEYGTVDYEVADAKRMVKTYLEALAEPLRAAGMEVETCTLEMQSTPGAIQHAARVLGADMIALATHGRTPLGRLIHGGTAWEALKDSEVPILYRHAEVADKRDARTHCVHDVRLLLPKHRRIMVPLDGSRRAEGALPLAQKLALEWKAPLHLVRVARYPVTPTNLSWEPAEFAQEAQAYLDRLAGTLLGVVTTRALVGPVRHSLAEEVSEEAVTDVVMSSHGRTGMARVLLGSVADALIHELTCPIVIVPSSASGEGSRGRDQSLPDRVTAGLPNKIENLIGKTKHEVLR